MDAPQAKKNGYFDGRRRQKTGILERAAGEKNGVFWQSGKFPCRTPPGVGGWGPDLSGLSKITHNLRGVSPMSRSTCTVTKVRDHLES